MSWLGLLKFIGGAFLAVVGFMGMIIAVFGFFFTKLMEVLQSTPMEDWPAIVIGIVGLILFLIGSYLLRHDC